MSRDERFYANPYEFSPERFITPEGTISDDRPPVFGFGRRICVGRWAADASMWIAIASILAVFRLDKAKDKFGNEIEIDGKYTDGIVSSPLPFECSMEPRSEAARQLILTNPPVTVDSSQIHFVREP